jgi:hypothetical protein
VVADLVVDGLPVGGGVEMSEYGAGAEGDAMGSTPSASTKERI